MFTWFKSCLALTLILGLCANSRGAEPPKSALVGDRPAIYDAPVNSASYSSVLSNNGMAGDCGGACSQGGCGAGCGKHGCGHGCHGCNGYYAGHFYSRCNMIPHIAYINPMKSYYYFRPYQAFHVREQQNEVVTYGGDPRDPYANLMFRSIYPELEAAWAEEAAQKGSPFEDEVPEGNAPGEDEEQPTDAPAPDANTSNFRAIPQQPKSQNPPAVLFGKPANNTATLPGNNQGVFRSYR